MERFPEIFTPRLHLRQLQVDDLPALVRHANNPKISDRVINIPHPYQEPDSVFRLSYVVQGFKARARFVFAIILKERQELIGEISLHLQQPRSVSEIGYWLGEQFWGQGIATEAIAAVLRFGFEKLNLELIFGTCHVENIASQQVLVKNGFENRGMTGSVIQFVLNRRPDLS